MPLKHNRAVPQYRGLHTKEIVFADTLVPLRVGIHTLKGPKFRPMLEIAGRNLHVAVFCIPSAVKDIRRMARAVRGLEDKRGFDACFLCPDVRLEFRVVTPADTYQCGLTIVSSRTGRECGRIVLDWRELGKLAEGLTKLRRATLKALDYA